MDTKPLGMDIPQKQPSKSKHMYNLVGSFRSIKHIAAGFGMYDTDTVFGVGASVTGKDSSRSRKNYLFDAM